MLLILSSSGPGPRPGPGPCSWSNFMVKKGPELML